MPDVRVELAAAPDEFRAKLRSLGVAAATHGMLVEGLDKSPDENAGFVFTYRRRTRGVGFHTDRITMLEARRIIAEVTTLQAGPPRLTSKQVITEYKLA